MMESLYKIDKIVGKGMGWIALRDIKCGTLIWKEKPQFNPINENARGLMECFFSMNSNDQKDWLYSLTSQTRPDRPPVTTSCRILGMIKTGAICMQTFCKAVFILES